MHRTRVPRDNQNSMRKAKESDTKMTKQIEIYDPAMCCSSGVCGPEPDPTLARFASDVKWLKTQGISVMRYSLSQEPRAFTSNAKVKEALSQHGDSCLPLILIDDEIVIRGAYPSRDQLATWTQLTGETECCCGNDSCCSEEPASPPDKNSCCGGENASSCCSE